MIRSISGIKILVPQQKSLMDFGPLIQRSPYQAVTGKIYRLKQDVLQPATA